jgi:hypothetical protein
MAAWRQESQREEIYLLDEMGGQAHLRRRQPAGGATLIALGMVVVLAASAGLLVVLGKHKPILERLGLLKTPVPEATPVPTPAAVPGEFTIRDLYGDPDVPANVVLGNLAARRRSIQAREQEIDEETTRLKAEREALAQSEKQFEDKLSNIQAQITRLEQAQKDEQARLASLHTQRVTEVSNAIQRMKPKSAADLLTEMWKTDPALDPDAKSIALEVFTQIPATKRNKVLDALVKTSSKEAADMVLKFIQLQPSGTPTPAPTS